MFLKKKVADSNIKYSLLKPTAAISYFFSFYFVLRCHKSDNNFDQAIYADRMPLYSVTIRLLQRRTNDLRCRLHR